VDIDAQAASVRSAGSVRQWRRVTVATPGEWKCKTAAARSGEWAQHFSNASWLVFQQDSALARCALNTVQLPHRKILSSSEPRPLTVERLTS